MSVFLSPGVFVREIDLSLYVPNLSTTALGVVGLATKGPINDPQYISDPKQFADKFGSPADPDVEFLPGVYSALQYLHTGRQLWFVRVAEKDPNFDVDADPIEEFYSAKYAKVDLSESATAPKVVGEINTLLTFTSSNNTMIFYVDGSGPGITLSVPLGDQASVTYSVPEIVTLLNSNAVFATFMVATTSVTGSLVITGKLRGSNHTLEVAGSVMEENVFDFPKPTAAFSTGTIVGTGTPSEKAFILGSNATFPLTVAVDTNDDLSFHVSKTGDSVVVTLNAREYTPEALVAALNSNDVASGDFSTTLVASLFENGTTSAQIKVALKSESSFSYLALVKGTNDAGLDVFGGINAKEYVTSNETLDLEIQLGVNDTLSFLLEDFDTPANTITFNYTIPAATYGDVTALKDALFADSAFTDELEASVVTINGGDDRLRVGKKGGTTFNALTLLSCTGELILRKQPSYRRLNSTTGTTLTIQATSAGTWGNYLSIEIVPVPTSGVQTAFNLNVYENGFYVEGYKNLVLTPLTISDPLAPGLEIDNPAYVENAINEVSPRITVTNATDNVLFPQSTGLNPRYGLNDGSNGSPPTGTSDPSLYIGVNTSTEKSGLQFFRNPEEMDINLIAVPGISDAAVINEMIDICQTRGDAMCIVDPPLGKRPQDVVDFVNGTGEYVTDHAALNSSYAAIYWPWLQIYDPVNKKKVWTPPSGHIANVYAYTDLVSDPWIAPAGLTRGHLTTPLRGEYNPTAGERDLLYLNNINPIATFVRDGLNVFGQKTLQRKPSSLDRVNVRRMMLYLEKVVATAARQLLFEPDDQVTWLSFVNLVEPFMQAVKDRRGLIDFQVRCDATTNTPDVVDRNEMRAIIFLKPTKAAEFIQIDFVLTAQGANFNELVF
jgi:hypothetical protein